MRKNNQKSLISVYFVCVKAAGSLGCSLAITTTLSKLLLHLAYVSKISQVSPEDPILTQLW